jgi:hypothetical protein
MLWHNSKPSLAVTKYLQNYSITCEKSPALMTYHISMVLLSPPVWETGSRGTELADYGSDLDSYTPECHIYVTLLNEQDQDVLSRHDPNETPIRSRKMT